MRSLLVLFWNNHSDLGHRYVAKRLCAWMVDAFLSFGLVDDQDSVVERRDFLVSLIPARLP
jgi:hypothetical protein